MNKLTRNSIHLAFQFLCGILHHLAYDLRPSPSICVCSHCTSASWGQAGPICVLCVKQLPEAVFEAAWEWRSHEGWFYPMVSQWSGFGEGQWNTSRKSFQSRSLAAQQRENQNEYSPESRSEKRHPRRGLVQVLHFLLWSLSTKYITSL
ncbi:uncharacterized protein [Canis lupus baileyi]